MGELSFLISFIFLCYHYFFKCSFSSSMISNETDYEALLAFKAEITQDPQGITTSWNQSLHFCNWQGITCSKKHQRVTILSVESLNLVGNLSPYIGNLTFLKIIDIYNNSFHGEIPHSIGKLFRLQVISMRRNSLQGQIPRNLSYCRNLRFILFGGNMLVGEIPQELSFLSNLTSLDLSLNSLTGKVTSFFANFSSLTSFLLNDNFLEGEIPDSFASLKNLKALSFGTCNFSGTIPPSIYNLSSLTRFHVSDNELHGNLPAGLGDFFPNLVELSVWRNNFTGQIPTSISNATKLIYIGMAENQFTGNVLVDFSGLTNLSLLSLNANQLGSGEIDDLSFINTLVNCSNLGGLGIHVNRFGGLVPSSLVNLSISVRQIVLGRNPIFGSIPSDIGKLVNLNGLGIYQTQVSGTIPISISNLQNMQMLSLFSNNLVGLIPSSIGNLTILDKLYLEDNRLDGRIPSSLSKFQKLIVMDLSTNKLNGTIPKEVFEISSLSIALDLSNNQLTGELPTEIGNLGKVAQLDFSGNRLTGEIPASLGSCVSLEDLRLDGNSFQGPIPSTFSSLRGLEDLDLSRNNLTGQIPEFLTTFSLISLNLSFNDLEGEVPIGGNLGNTSVVSFVGNDRLCGGSPELQLPKCTSRKGKNRHISRSLIIGISIGGTFFAIAMVLLIIIFLQKRKKEVENEDVLGKELFSRVSYEMLFKATDGFSSANLMGVGSFGSVYKGNLEPDNTIVAVKVLNLQRRGALKSFSAECEALGQAKHRNLVKVITACSSIDFQGNEFKALVYEYMSNGSLDKWLHPITAEDEPLSLDFLQRLNIVIDVACALEYLHNQCQPPIVHCDLKPSNILLDSGITAHVGDFGLAKLLIELTDSTTINQSCSIGVRGTIGYAAPEYGVGGEVSTYGDLYSYGITVLEMFTGKRPTDVMFEEAFNLHEMAKAALAEQVKEVVDPTILVINSNRRRYLKEDRKLEDCLRSIIGIGVSCSMESPRQRMEIRVVVSDLQDIKNALLANKN